MAQAWFVGEHVIDVPSVKASATSQGAENRNGMTSDARTHRSSGCAYRQLSPMTRTDETFRCCAFAIEPLAEPAAPAAELVAPAVEGVLLLEPDMLVSSVPVTSTFLLVFEVSSDWAEPGSRM
jgi:hypothetical protein